VAIKYAMTTTSSFVVCEGCERRKLFSFQAEWYCVCHCAIGATRSKKDLQDADAKLIRSVRDELGRVGCWVVAGFDGGKK